MVGLAIDRRYRVLGRLGAGAMGEVYKVRDLRDGGVYALKMLSQERTTSDAVRRFRREFRLLAQLRHPNLCRVYDFGVLRDGRSYFTMEYVAGRDIYEATRGMVCDRVYPLVVQLCRVLEYIHSKGLVHYDIKPGNVLVSEVTGGDGQVKLMDFGLTGERQIRGGVRVKGTLPYIAPEVIEDLGVDHRADLYSLGVLLYEVFTRRSFSDEERTSFVSLLQRRLSRRLLPGFIAGLPGGLGRVILRLIAFEPSRRYARANEVIEEFSRVAGVGFALETERTLEGYLLSSRFVGRERELRVLELVVDGLGQSGGRTVVIVGEPGIGKSRLLREFRISLQMRRIRPFIGAVHREPTMPLEAFHDIFQELIQHIGGDPRVLDTRLRFGLAVIFRLFPDLRLRRLSRYLPRIVPLPTTQDRLRNFDALLGFLYTLADDLGRLVILLEDIHWADELTVRFLEYLGRNAGDAPLLVFASARGRELAENVLLKGVIEGLVRGGRLSRVELGPLDAKNFSAFLDSVITPGSNSPELSRYLLKKTGGNPYFLEEFMRVFLRKAAIQIGEPVVCEDLREITMPDSIDGIISKHLDGLDKEKQLILRYAALLGNGFHYDFMKNLTGFDDTLLSRALWELRKWRIFIEKDNRYQFYHPTLQEAVCRRIRGRDLRTLSGRIGRVLEDLYKEDQSAVIDELAQYFIDAQDRKKGVTYGIRAAARSADRYANEQALRFYRGVLSLLADKKSRKAFDILKAMAHLEFLIGYGDKGMRYYRKALSLKKGSVDEIVDIHIGMANICNSRADYRAERIVMEKAMSILGRMKNGGLKRLLKNYIKARICKAYLNRNENKRVPQITFRNLASLRSLKGKRATRLLGSLYSTLGFIEEQKAWAGASGYDRAIFYHREAGRYHRIINNESGEAAALISLGNCYHQSCALSMVDRYYKRAINISRRIGDPHGLAIGMGNLAMNYLDRGDYSKALGYLQKALPLARRFGSPLCYKNIGMGACYLNLGEYERAIEYFKKSLQEFEAIGSLEGKTYPLRGLGSVCRAVGDYAKALGFFRRSLKIARNINHRTNIADSMLALGITMIDLGQFTRARHYIDEARKIARGIGMAEIMLATDEAMCQLNLLSQSYEEALDYFNRGRKQARRMGMKHYSLHFLLHGSAIDYYLGYHRRGLRSAAQAVRRAEGMGTKDLLVEALILKKNHGVRLGILTADEVVQILTKAKGVAEDIRCPELRWKVYLEYAQLYHDKKNYKKALDYYQRCHGIFKDLADRIKNKSYLRSYLNRPDRQVVFARINELAGLF